MTLTPQSLPGASSLHADRDWLAVCCPDCDMDNLVAARGADANCEPVLRRCEAALPGGELVEVEVLVAEPAATLRWACNGCGSVHEADL